MKILIIESDESFASSLSHALQANGAEVQTVSEGEAGFALARAEVPDAIVLSVELGDRPTSGFVICNKIKRDETLRERPLVLMSALATDETLSQHSRLKTRADTYLRKPFEPAQLISALGLQPPAPDAPHDFASEASSEEELLGLGNIDDIDLTGLVGEGPIFSTGLLEEKDDAEWEEVEFDVGPAEEEAPPPPPPTPPPAAPVTPAPQAAVAAPAQPDRSAALEAELAALRQASEAKDAEFAALRQASEAKDAELASLRQAGEAKDAELATLRQASEAKDAELATLRQGNETKDAELAALRQEYEATQAELEAARVEVAALRDETGKLQGRIDELETQLQAAARSEDLEKELEAANAEKSKLEADVNRSQERLLRAYRKLKHDAQVHQRLRQSLTDALELIDALEAKGGE